MCYEKEMRRMDGRDMDISLVGTLDGSEKTVAILNPLRDMCLF